MVVTFSLHPLPVRHVRVPVPVSARLIPAVFATVRWLCCQVNSFAEAFITEPGKFNGNDHKSVKKHTT